MWGWVCGAVPDRMVGSAFNPTNAGLFATGSEAGNLFVWNAEQRAPIYTLRFPTAITSIAWSPDGKQIAGVTTLFCLASA